MLDAPSIANTAFYWTGVVVWTLAVLYVVPMLPVIPFVLVYRAAFRFESWWAEYWWASDLDQYKEYRDDGHWVATVEVGLSHIIHGSETGLDGYLETIWPAYGLLPGLSRS